MDNKEIYENGTVRLEIRDDIVWLQNGMAGFWLKDKEFQDLIDMLVELYGTENEAEKEYYDGQ